ncbi:MAG: hypothetical protein MK135_17160, partial [Polyangiaceae bacterium]|nr:hypothetical protein [Polyangiaceae bacterium]
MRYFFPSLVGLSLFVACSTPRLGEPDGDENPGTEPPPECRGELCTAQSACSSSVAGSPLLRRLTAKELRTTLEVTFPSIASNW